MAMPEQKPPQAACRTDAPKTPRGFRRPGTSVGQGKFLRQLIDGGSILPGPVSAQFVFSAVLSGVKEIRQIVEQANSLREQSPKPTILLLTRFTGSTRASRMPFFPCGKRSFDPDRGHDGKSFV
jgi:putative ATPase